MKEMNLNNVTIEKFPKEYGEFTFNKEKHNTGPHHSNSHLHNPRHASRMIYIHITKHTSSLKYQKKYPSSLIT